jgi:hypothetical protein
MTRDELEASLTRRISAALADQLRALQDLLELGIEPNEFWWERQGVLLQDALLPTLAQIAVAGHDAVGFPVKFDDDELRRQLDRMRIPVENQASIDAASAALLTGPRSAIYDWLLVHGAEVIKDITITSRQALAGALEAYQRGGMTLQELMDAIAPSFGVDRALRIAVTESTRAFDLGDQAATRELIDAGFEVKDIWNTNRDSLVDEDCAERDGLDSADWPTPQRPPLHVNCRCWVTHSVFG